MKHRCICRCHTPPDTAREDVLEAVDVADPLEAAVACMTCQPVHCPALLTPKAAPQPRSALADLERSLAAARKAIDLGEGDE